MRRITLVLLLFLSIAACDRAESTGEHPTAEEPDPRQSEWDQLVQRIEGPELAPVERIDAVQEFIDRGAARRASTERARRLLATLEARRMLRGALYGTSLKLPEMAENAARVRAVQTGEPRELARLTLLEILRTQNEFPSSSAMKTVEVRPPSGGAFEISTRPMFVGLGSVRNLLDLLMLEADSPPGAPTRYSRGAWEQNLAFNELLQPHLGGPLFDTSRPGRLNEATFRKLAAIAESMMDDEYLGLGLPTIAYVFEPRLREYDDVYDELRKVGERKVVRDYRRAYRKYEADQHLDVYRYEMPNFYESWSDEHGIARAIEGNRWSVPFAVGFWMRRMDDGTAASIHRLLRKTLASAD